MAGPRKNRVSELFKTIFFFNFEARNTKGLKPFQVIFSVAPVMQKIFSKYENKYKIL